MGVIKQGILGGFSNKVGTVIGSSWKGIAVMRSMPLSVANPKTAAQVANRSKFGQITKLGLQILSSTIQPNFNPIAKKMSGYNLWCKINRDLYEGKTAVQMAGAIVVSKGELSNSDILMNYTTGASSFTLTWDKTVKNPKDQNTDKLVVVGIEIPKTATSLDECIIAPLNVGTVTRNAETTSNIYYVPDSTSNTYVAAYFVSADGKLRSDSACLQVIQD